MAEADVLDVTTMTAGAVVDYTNGQVRNLAGQVQVTIEGIVDIETVLADGNDTVIVADAAVMNDNARSDELNGTPAENILFMTYRDFDDLNTGATTRKTFAAQVADGTINKVINQGQFTFSLSETGTGADIDRVDYSNELGRIIVPVGQGTATTPQYVVVDGNNNQVFTDAESRVDVLKGVEEIVAAKGASVMDFTAVGQARQITFQYNTAMANPAENAVIEQSIRIADGSGNTVSGLSAFIEKYTYNKTTAPVADATWNQIEGGDAAEVVIYQGSEDLVNQAGLDHRYTNDVLTLRGGLNEVRYSPLETSITANITVTEENTATAGVAEGLISATINFQNGVGGALAGGGTHTITSYTSDNSTAAGNLKIEGSQDAEDTVSFTTSSKKVYVLGTSPGVINVNIGSLNSLVLTGFEILKDSASNDVYDFASLSAVAGVTLADDAVTSTDHDTIKVRNDAIGYNASGAGTIDLDKLSATTGGFNMDFDVLDVTAVTAGGLILKGGTNLAPVNATDTDTTDEVVLGALGLVTSTTGFESVVLTQGTVAAGSAFTFNAGTSLVQGSTTVLTNSSVLSFGGTVLELGTDSATGLTIYGTPHVANVTTGVTVNVGTAGATVHGGNGNDILNGGASADVLRGGLGNDTLNGGVSSEVRFIQINPTGASGAAGTATTITLDGLMLTLNNVAGAPVDTDANAGNNLDITAGVGSNAVGTALAALVNANLVDINDGIRFGGTQLLNAAYSDTTGNLTFTFVGGTDVAVGDTIAIAGTGLGAITVGAEAVVTDGGSGGNDTYIVDAGSDTINNLNGSDVLVVYGDATATASGVTNFVATAATKNLGTVTINASDVGSTIDLSLAAAISGTTATKGFTVVGGTGVDTITGSSKGDVMTGGAGNDVFVIKPNAFGTSGTFDTITDFATTADKLDMVVAGAGGNYVEINGTGMTFAAAQAAAQALFNTTVAAHVFVYDVAGDGYLFSDVTLDNAIDGQVKLTGLTTAAGLNFTDII
ncbi:MAG: calcium-binding protein [Burkholderiaceae bacterium]|nr:calcium-binding protein [Burkholderiaceae bacterium]